MEINNHFLKNKPTIQNLLIQHILDEGFRVFNREQLAESINGKIELSYQALSNHLLKLCAKGWLKKIKSGVYLSPKTSGSPILENEIAMYLLRPCVISHRSAFSYHGLTDQIITDVYITTTDKTFVPKKGTKDKKSAINYAGVEYLIIRTSEDRFFGHKTAWCDDSKFKITDIERTFLDGLSQPKYCGGFSEVIWAFQENLQRANINKLIDYAMRLDDATSRRLGWILDEFSDIDNEQISCLSRYEGKGYRLQDPSKPAVGEFNKKWKLQMNHFLE